MIFPHCASILSPFAKHKIKFLGVNDYIKVTKPDSHGFSKIFYNMFVVERVSLADPDDTLLHPVSKV